VLSWGGLGDQSAAPALLPSPSGGRFLVTELNPRNVRFVRFGLRYPDFVEVWDIFYKKIISNLDEFWGFSFYHGTSVSSPKAYNNARFLLPMNFRQILTYPNSPDFSKQKRSLNCHIFLGKF